MVGQLAEPGDANGSKATLSLPWGSPVMASGRQEKPAIPLGPLSISRLTLEEIRAEMPKLSPDSAGRRRLGCRVHRKSGRES